jgi:prepilin-type processing-associated H-X9-DG protein
MELLVVIAIMTTLAALLFPVLAQARRAAMRTRCLSNLCQIARAQLLYMDDWDERFPNWYFQAPPRPEPWGKFAFWTEYFHPYLRSDAILRCPEATWSGNVPEAKKLATYVLVTWGRGGRGTRQAPFWNWPGSPYTLSQVHRPSETLTLLDGFTTSGHTSVELSRHHGGANVAFVDGHLRWLKAGEFWAADTDAYGVWWMRHASVDW